ncbi:MAG: fabZ [Gammaproteobacteria bacterium]|nr:fabZ [Gammaproteobacteria bacterium]
MTPLDINVIKNYLPHRYPFLLIDRIVAFEKDKYLTALKNVTMNEPFFLGHFPTKPIMPGVLIVEAMAQASAIFGNLSMQDRPEDGSLYYLVGIDKARFRHIVVPGDQLLLKVDFLTVRRNIWKFSAKATVADKTVASAEFLTTVVEPDV